MDGQVFLRCLVAATGLLSFGLLATTAKAENLTVLGDVHFRAIKIDVTPLASNSVEPTASWLAQALLVSLQSVFANRLAPGDRSAPTLVVRIDSVFLGGSGNGIFDATGADRARDNIQGASIIVAPSGRTMASYPIFDVLYSYTGGSNYEVGSEHRRINELAAGLAQWLPGQMGL
jgi:hypothetical protein